MRSRLVSVFCVCLWPFLTRQSHRRMLDEPNPPPRGAERGNQSVSFTLARGISDAVGGGPSTSSPSANLAGVLQGVECRH
jgi:hypothetical protein